MNKPEYKSVELEIITFTSEDVITDSCVNLHEEGQTEPQKP